MADEDKTVTGRLKKTEEAAKKTGEAAKDLTKAIGGIGTALDGINSSVLDGGNSMKGLADNIQAVGGAAGKLGSILNKLVSIVPGLDGAGSALGSLGSIFNGIGTIMSEFVKQVDESAKVMDGLTGINREMTASLFGAAAGFGAGVAEAKLYKDMVLSMADDFATKEFGFIRVSEAKEMFDFARRAKLSIEDLSAVVTAGGASMQGYAAGILQASAMGLDLATYSGLLGDAIYGQGLDTKEAMLQLSLFRDIANDTGVAIDDVTGTLQNISASFRTMGIRADFGEPILRGFAASLKDIGLGAENAGKLTESLTGSIAKIASDPALAFITSKFGDLGYGQGGGALQASIDMQAELLRSENTGDQSKVGLKMATAMRDTLAQVTGGQGIVTVFDAEKDSSLTNTNYAQKSLLEGMFGVSASDSQRTLEMLANLEEATRTGNTELATQIGLDFAEGKNVRNETQGWQDAMSAKVDAAVAELSLQTSSLLGVAHHLGLLEIDRVGTEMGTLVSNKLSDLGITGANDAARQTSMSMTTGAITDANLIGMIKGARGVGAMQESVLATYGPGTATGSGGGAPPSIDISGMDPSFQVMILRLGGIERGILSLVNGLRSGLSLPGVTGTN
jgi:hypothetical protein